MHFQLLLLIKSLDAFLLPATVLQEAAPSVHFSSSFDIPGTEASATAVEMEWLKHEYRKVWAATHSTSHIAVPTLASLSSETTSAVSEKGKQLVHLLHTQLCSCFAFHSLVHESIYIYIPVCMKAYTYIHLAHAETSSQCKQSALLPSGLCSKNRLGHRFAQCIFCTATTHLTGMQTWVHRAPQGCYPQPSPHQSHAKLQCQQGDELQQSREQGSVCWAAWAHRHPRLHPALPCTHCGHCLTVGLSFVQSWKQTIAKCSITPFCAYLSFQWGFEGKAPKAESAVFMCSLMHSGNRWRFSFSVCSQLHRAHFFLLHGATHSGAFLAKITLLQTLGGGKLLWGTAFPTEPSTPSQLLPLLTVDGTEGVRAAAAPGDAVLCSVAVGEVVVALLLPPCSTSIFTTGAVCVM